MALLDAPRFVRNRTVRRVRVGAAVAFACLASALVACSSPQESNPPPQFEPISSTFDTDTEGWTTTEPNDPSWQAPGYLQVVDNADGWQYAIAPAKFHGDWSLAELVRFMVLADSGPLTIPLRVVLGGSGQRVYQEFDLNELDPGGWVEFSASLGAEDWRLVAGEESQGSVASRAQVESILADVDELWIRLDLTTKSDGDELNGIDDVVVE